MATISYLIGGLSTFLLIYQVLLILEQEFSDEDDIIKKPLAVAACGAVRYDDFKNDDWRAFAALSSAMTLQCFVKRFRILLNPTFGKVIMISILALYLGLSVPAFVQPWPDWVKVGIGSLATITNVYWLVIIERARLLKKNLERLKVL